MSRAARSDRPLYARKQHLQPGQNRHGVDPAPRFPSRKAMSAAALPRHCQIERINYYTAHISGRVDPDAPRRQHAYLRAIATLPKVVIHYGNFLVN